MRQLRSDCLRGKRTNFNHEPTLDQQLYTLHGNDMRHLRSDRLKEIRKDFTRDHILTNNSTPYMELICDN